MIILRSYSRICLVELRLQSRSAHTRCLPLSHSCPSSPRSQILLPLKPLTKISRAGSTKSTNTPTPKATPSDHDVSNQISTKKKASSSPNASVSEKKPTPLAYDSKGKSVFPEKLLIYHAGNGRIMFISLVRFTSILILVFGSCWIAPQFYFSPYEPTWKAPVAIGASAIPLLIMVYTTAPFICYVHLSLPIWARASSIRLHRFANALPSTAELDLTTLRWIWPRVTRLHISELHVNATRLGPMTINREIPEALKTRPWWAWSPLKSFYLAGKSSGKIPEKGVWDETLQCITRGWAKPGLRGKLFAT